MNGRMKLNEFDELTTGQKLNHIYSDMVCRAEFNRLKIKVYSGLGALCMAGVVLKWFI